MTVGVVATLLMATISRGDWAYAALVFMIANIGIAASFVFYDSLLPHIAAPEEMDRVSTAAYAIGYLGGGVLLVVNLAWILSPATFGLADSVAAIRLSFVSVAVWWLVFSLPLFFRVPEPAPSLEADESRSDNAVRLAFVRLRETFHELRGYRQAFLMLVAFLLYNDGIQTIIRMASIYGAEVGIDQNAQIAAFVLVQFVGVPCSFLFGALAHRIGAKLGVFLALDDLRRHQPARLFHDHGVAVLRAGVSRGHGSGRQPGAQPFAVRAHDSEAQVVGVTSVSSRFSRSSRASRDQRCSRLRSRCSTRAEPPCCPSSCFRAGGTGVDPRRRRCWRGAGAQQPGDESFDRTRAFTPCFWSALIRAIY